jgi:hypothetical protein
MAAPQTTQLSNDSTIQVTQELAALRYVEEPGSLDPVLPAFLAGFRGDPCDPPMSLAVWESGALAAELKAIGGQR